MLNIDRKLADPKPQGFHSDLHKPGHSDSAFIEYTGSGTYCSLTVYIQFMGHAAHSFIQSMENAVNSCIQATGQKFPSNIQSITGYGMWFRPLFTVYGTCCPLIYTFI